MSTDNESIMISRRVREYRRLAGLTQEDLARRSGLKQQSISAIENGRMMINVHHLYAIARALAISVVELLPPDESEEA